MLPMGNLQVPRWVWLLVLVLPPVGVAVLFWYARQGSQGWRANFAELLFAVTAWFGVALFGVGFLVLVFGGPGWPLIFWSVVIFAIAAGFDEWSKRIAARRESDWINRWYDVTLAPLKKWHPLAEEFLREGAPGVILGTTPYLEWVEGRGVAYPYLRAGETRPILCSRWELATLLLGPPRSGKTRSVIIPSVLAAPGPVVSTSTKLDVLGATVSVRAKRGECWLFDPTGTQAVPAGVKLARWTPVASASTWEGARRAARTMIDAVVTGADADNGAHWRDGGRNLLAGMLHGAARSGLGMPEVCSWLAQRSLTPMVLNLAVEAPEGLDLGAIETPTQALAALRQMGECGLVDRGAAEMLTGTVSATEREASGFWSYALRAVEVYQSPAANGTRAGETFDFDAFARSKGTVYIAASRREQELVAPIISAFIEEVVDARLRLHRTLGSPRVGTPTAPPQMLLALDEVANIAPLRTLPQLVSEGGGQGVTVLATFQDLSQARERYGDEATGFLSLFGTTLLFPGCRDEPTVDLISKLCGEFVEVTAQRQRAETYRNGRKPETVQITTSESREYRPAVPFDVVSMGIAGHAIVLTDGSVPPGWVCLTPEEDDGVWDWYRKQIVGRGLYEQARVIPPLVFSADIDDDLDVLTSVTTEVRRSTRTVRS